MRTCADCKHKQKIGNVFELTQPEFCLRYPPTPQLVLQQTKFGQQTGTVNIYPTVNDQTPACGEYQENSDLTS